MDLKGYAGVAFSGNYRLSLNTSAADGVETRRINQKHLCISGPGTQYLCNRVRKNSIPSKMYLILQF
jgi:hypothetical protein